MGFVSLSLIEWECNYKSYRLVQLPVLSVLCLHLIAVGIAALVRLRGQKIINFGEGRPAIEIVRVDLELLRTVPGFSAAPLTAVALISEIALRCDLQISGIRVAPQMRLHLQGRGVCRFRLTLFPILFLPQALRLRCCALFRDTRNSYVVSNLPHNTKQRFIWQGFRLPRKTAAGIEAALLIGTGSDFAG